MNQAVKRNPKRFPADFMFRLTDEEKKEVVTNCDRFKMLKHSTSLPYAFTEQGVAMLSSVLNSEKAILVNIQIMRVFIRLRVFLSTHRELADKLKQLESKVKKHDIEIQAIFEAIQRLIEPPVEEKPKRRIGFHGE